MGKKWIFLCSAALGAIYAAEYVITEAPPDTQNRSNAEENIQSLPQPYQENLQTENVPSDSSAYSHSQSENTLTDNPQTEYNKAERNPTQSTNVQGTQSADKPTQSTNVQGTQSADKPTQSTNVQGTQSADKPTQSTNVQGTQSADKPTQSTNVQGTQSADKPTQSVQPKRVYQDGTFTGMGSNRRGSIQVSVTIKNDKITDVEIVNFAMHYSENDIIGLPDEVLKRQSAQVDNVSGATYSTRAFEDAVQDALDKAKNA